MIEQLLSYFSFYEKIILISALFALVAQLYYYLGIFGRLAFHRTRNDEISENPQPVSVIICARNEQASLEQYLSRILEQNYPKFEVIVVNDGSEDDSEILLASMQSKYPNLIFRTLVKDDTFAHSKKMALGVGIKAASYDLLLFTDTDCYPSSNEWLYTMQSYFVDKTNIVLGYTRLIDNRRWIRADRMMHALHYLGKALKHKPYMGVGSNLAYRKKIFFDNKGFDIRITGNLKEDRVFINKVATHDNTAVAISPKAVTVSTLRVTAERWRRERHEEMRSFSLCRKGSRYPELAEILYRILFFVSIGIAIVHFFEHPVMLPVLLGVVLFRLILQQTLFFLIQRRFGEKGLLFTLFIWDLVFPLTYLVLIFTSKIYRINNNKRRLWI